MTDATHWECVRVTPVISNAEYFAYLICSRWVMQNCAA
ncbi:hypothetical protein [Azospirillum argentinense]